MEISYPIWLPKSFGSQQGAEEMNGLVEVLQNHAENISEQHKRIIATSGGIYPGKIVPESNIPENLTQGAFIISVPGTYSKFGNVTLPVADENNVYIGLIFWDGKTFSLETIAIPKQDMQPVNDAIQRMDDFIRNFSVEVDQEFNDISEAPQSGVAIAEEYKGLDYAKSNAPLFLKIGDGQPIGTEEVDISKYLINNAWVESNGSYTSNSQSTGYSVYFKIPLIKGVDYEFHFTYLPNDAKKYYYLYDSNGVLIERVAYYGESLKLNNVTASYITLQKRAKNTSSQWWEDDIIVKKTIYDGETDVLFDGKLYYNNEEFIDFSELVNQLEYTRLGWTDFKQNPILTDASKYARDSTYFYDETTNIVHCFYWTDKNIIYCNAPADTLFFSNKVIKITGEGRPCILKKDGVFYLYTWKNFKIYLRTFTDFNGIYTEPIEVMTATLNWEDGQIWSPWVLFDSDENIWKMWYTCSFISPDGLGWTEPRRCGYATSNDGKIWTKRTTPILEGTNDLNWTDTAIMTLHPIKMNNMYYALLSAGDINGNSRVGVVMSNDGINWDLENSRPINLGSKNEFNSSDMYTGQLLKVKNNLLLFANARQYSNSNAEYTGVYHLAPSKKIDNEKYLITRKDSSVTNQIFSQVNDIITFSNIFADTSNYEVVDFAPIWLHGVFTNKEIIAKVKIKTQQKNTGFSFDLRNSGKLSTDNYNGISIDFFTGTERKYLRVVKYVNSVATKIKENYLFPINNNLIFDVKIKVEGSRYQVFINSMKVFDFNDETFSSGKFGFRAYYGEIDFLIED
ncbi:hypothetical protein [Empedobacter tilapiae]|uniref:hypothetical protein n=1 Tax=Empedobacter tilapiae TaxID=2491114 RepID=UPI0028D89F6C|nr:hypothetical protein [Empedobacter tilapiae]